MAVIVTNINYVILGKLSNLSESQLLLYELGMI